MHYQQKVTYDAIVVGSGMSGGWAMKELCEKGLKTLVLERGRLVEHGRDYVTEHKAAWELPYRGQVPPEVGVPGVGVDEVASGGGGGHRQVDRQGAQRRVGARHRPRVAPKQWTSTSTRRRSSRTRNSTWTPAPP